MDLNRIPALDPPPGQRSNFVNPYSQKNYLIITSVICLAFTFVSITARMFVKAYILKKVQWEDYALIFAGISFVAFIALQFPADSVGQGRHQWDVSLAQAQQLALYENIGQILYCPITFAAKIAVLLQIMRVFKGNRRDSIYWSIQILIWTNFVFYTGIFFCSIFACMPREKIQDPMIHGRCIDSKKSIIATSAINIVSDFTILLLPAFAVWKIQIALKRKMVIAGVFGTGLFACVASILRLVYSVRFASAADGSYMIHTVVLWCMAEITTVIVAGASPTMPRLWQWCRSLGNDPQKNISLQSSSRAKYPNRTPRSNAAGLPWDGSSTATTKLANCYIPLHDQTSQYDPKCKAYSLQQVPSTEYFRSHEDVEKSGDGRHHGQILKTVRVETDCHIP